MARDVRDLICARPEISDIEINGFLGA